MSILLFYKREVTMHLTGYLTVGGGVMQEGPGGVRELKVCLELPPPKGRESRLPHTTPPKPPQWVMSYELCLTAPPLTPALFLLLALLKRAQRHPAHAQLTELLISKVCPLSSFSPGPLGKVHKTTLRTGSKLCTRSLVLGLGCGLGKWR